jgi:hypothetical protein
MEVSAAHASRTSNGPTTAMGPLACRTELGSNDSGSYTRSTKVRAPALTLWPHLQPPSSPALQRPVYPARAPDQNYFIHTFAFKIFKLPFSRFSLR